MDSEGKRIVRNAQTRSFLQFLEQYQEMVHHALHELDDVRFLTEENKIPERGFTFLQPRSGVLY